MNVLLRLPEVLRASGRRKTQFYLDIRRGLRTPGVRIGDHAVAWPADEVDAINRARIAGLDDDAIRALVERLVADRGRIGPTAAAPRSARRISLL